jgi:3-oxoacyl-[acyl-carrier-protein] synthase II
MEEEKMPNRVVITGLGCISPIGNDVETTWRNIVAGKSGAGLITRFNTEDFKVRIAAEVKGFDGGAVFGVKNARRMDLYTQFALVAALQAQEDAALEIHDGNRDRIGVVVGTGIGGMNTMSEQVDVYNARGAARVSPFLVPMMIPDTGAATISIQLGLRGPSMAIVTACATGTNAVGEAAEIIRRGAVDVMFAGGSEAAVVPIAVAGLANMTALSTRNDEPERASRPFDKDRDGFVMGEGAAILILESYQHAVDRKAKILAEIVGYGSNSDAFHISAPAPDGEGAILCMRQALDSAGLGVDDIDYINAHGTSTPLNDASETIAIKRTFGERAYNVPISSTKSMTGHLMGSSGALEALFCVKALENGVIPPTINYETPDETCDLDYVPNEPRLADMEFVMSNSFGFGGHNATIILRRSGDKSKQ